LTARARFVQDAVTPISAPLALDVPGVPGGLLPGTRLFTVDGVRTVDRLRAGDLLLDRDGAPVRLLRVIRTALTDLPVIVDVDACGYGSPARPLLMSADHCIVVGGTPLEECFGLIEALAPVGALVNGRTVRRAGGETDAVAHHLLCDRPAVLVAEGMLVQNLSNDGTQLPLLTHAEARLLALAGWDTKPGGDRMTDEGPRLSQAG